MVREQLVERVQSGTPVVRKDAARRPGDDNSKTVGSSSRPMSGMLRAAPVIEMTFCMVAT